MTNPRPFPRALALTSCIALALSGCTLMSGEPQTGSSHSSSTRAGQGSDGTSAPSPEAISTEPVTVTPGQAKAVTSTLTADTQGVTATALRFPQARNLSLATDVVQARMLREGFYTDATNTSVTSQVIASSDAVVGVQMTASIKGAEPQTIPATLWYSTANKQTYSSPALIKGAQWAAFASLVGQQAGELKLDAAKVAAALNDEAAPYGNGPALAFTKAGDLLVQFRSGAVAKDAATVPVAKEKATPLLSVFGAQAQQAATAPSAFTGTTTARPDSELAPRPKASPSAGSASPTPSPSTTPANARPSTAVGPDCRVVKCVSLTYDDGPGPRSLELLKTIKKHNATATFFQMGNSITAYPETTTTMAAAGMEIGSHTVTHPNLAAASKDRVTREVVNNSALIKKYTGVTPLLFRPPYGSHNQMVRDVVGANGMSVIQWEVDSEDWRNRNAAKTTHNVLASTNYTAPISLQHDIHDASIDSAEGIYSALQHAGRTLVSVSELVLNSGGVLPGHAYCRGTSMPQEGFNCKG